MESAEGFEVIGYVPAPCLKYNQPGTTYTCVQLPDDPTLGEKHDQGCQKFSAKVEEKIDKK